MKLSIVFAACLFTSTAFAWSQTERSEMRGHMGWCLKNYGQEDGRQGVRLYHPGSDSYRDLNQLREDFIRCQFHNYQAVTLLSKVSDREFTQALNANVIEMEEIVWNHMNWVARQAGRAEDLVQAAMGGNPFAIREIYNKAQRDNPTARVNLKAVSDEFLISICKNY